MEKVKEVIQTAVAGLVSVIEKLKREPVLVRTVLALVVSLGFVNLTDVQVDTINQAVVGLLVLLGSASARALVIPLTPPEVKKQRVRKTVKKQRAKVAKAQQKIAKVGGAKRGRKKGSTNRRKK